MVQDLIGMLLKHYFPCQTKAHATETTSGHIFNLSMIAAATVGLRSRPIFQTSQLVFMHGTPALTAPSWFPDNNKSCMFRYTSIQRFLHLAMHQGFALLLRCGMHEFRRRIQLAIITNKIGTKIETRKALQHSMALELRANAADHMLDAMRLHSHRQVFRGLQKQQNNKQNTGC